MKTIEQLARDFCYKNTHSLAGTCDLPDEDIYIAGYNQGRQDALKECLEICDSVAEDAFLCEQNAHNTAFLVKGFIEILMQQEHINNEGETKCKI